MASLCIHSECGKTQTIKNPNMDTFRFLRSVSSGGEPVSTIRWYLSIIMRHPYNVQDIQNPIDLITTLESVGCYILLPTYNVEMTFCLVGTYV